MLKNTDLTRGLRLTVISLAGLIALVLAACVPAVPVGNPAGKPTVEPLPTMETSPAAPISAVQPGTKTPMGGSTFSEEVHPILQEKCLMCHNATLRLGGWDASSYASIMTTGDSAPVVLSGDVQNSRLAQLLQGADGNTMPPMVALPPEEIQAILDWIAAGANQ